MSNVSVVKQKKSLFTTLISPKDISITLLSSSSSHLSWLPPRLHSEDEEGSQVVFSRVLLLTKDVDSRELLVAPLKEENSGKLLVRRLLSVLRRAEIGEGEQEEPERREDTVEEKREGWRDGHDGGCATEPRSGEMCVNVQLCDKSLFSRFGGA